MTSSIGKPTKMIVFLKKYMSESYYDMLSLHRSFRNMLFKMFFLQLLILFRAWRGTERQRFPIHWLTPGITEVAHGGAWNWIQGAQRQQPGVGRELGLNAGTLLRAVMVPVMSWLLGHRLSQEELLSSSKGDLCAPCLETFFTQLSEVLLSWIIFVST